MFSHLHVIITKLLSGENVDRNYIVLTSVKLSRQITLWQAKREVAESLIQNYILTVSQSIGYYKVSING